MSGKADVSIEVADVAMSEKDTLVLADQEEHADSVVPTRFHSSTFGTPCKKLVAFILIIIILCTILFLSFTVFLATIDPWQRPVPSTANFVVVGDWGRDGQYSQRDVASGMNQFCSSLPDGCLSAFTVGDNYYSDGVQSQYDSNWATSWADIYTGAALKLPWFAALGNHDYRGNASAQSAYMYSFTVPEIESMLEYNVNVSAVDSELFQYEINPSDSGARLSVPSWFAGAAQFPASNPLVFTTPRWFLPARYYTLTYINPVAKVRLRFHVFDSNVFIMRYRVDPDYVGKFDQQNYQLQLNWMEQQLNLTAQMVDDGLHSGLTTYSLVLVHHPIYSAALDHAQDTSYMQSYVLPLLAGKKVHAVLAGHDHQMQYVLPNSPMFSPPYYFVCGGGSKVRVDREQNYTIPHGFYPSAGFCGLSADQYSLNVTLFNEETVPLRTLTVQSPS